MKQIEFTDPERAAMIQLLDLAVRNGGLKVSGAANYLAAKFEDPAPQEEAQQADSDEEPKIKVEEVEQ